MKLTVQNNIDSLKKCFSTEMPYKTLEVPAVNFTNILRAAFLYESFTRSFLDLDLRFFLFWRKNMDAKAARNMLVKLTPGRLLLNFMLFYH